MKYKNVLFDLDGTIFDSSLGIIKTFNRITEHLGLEPIPQEVIHTFIGPSDPENLSNHFDVSKEIFEKFGQMFGQIYSENIFDAKIYDGMLELFEKLKSQSIKLSIATNKFNLHAQTMTDKFNLRETMDFVQGANAERTLDKKGIMEICLEKLNAKPEETLMIGDTIHDGSAAKELGIDFIAVKYGFGFKEKSELEESKPVFIANDVYEIIDFLFN